MYIYIYTPISLSLSLYIYIYIYIMCFYYYRHFARLRGSRAWGSSGSGLLRGCRRLALKAAMFRGGGGASPSRPSEGWNPCFVRCTPTQLRLEASNLPSFRLAAESYLDGRNCQSMFFT